jgi:hypothetical protein
MVKTPIPAHEWRGVRGTASMLKARKFRWNYRLTSCGFFGNLLNQRRVSQITKDLNDISRMTLDHKTPKRYYLVAFRISISLAKQWRCHCIVTVFGANYTEEYSELVQKSNQRRLLGV